VWDSTSIWRVDPSGQFWKCRAAAIGRSRPKVEALLVKRLSPPNSTADGANATTSAATTEEDKDRALTQDEAIQLAVESVQSVIPKERRLFGLVVTTGNKRTLTHEILMTTAPNTIIKH
jgi:20S proteasome alpha/beta subunit